MKRIILFLSFVIFIQVESQCQFSMPIQPWAKDIENRILIVTLHEENPKKVKRLQRKDKQGLVEYRKSITDYNNKLKELIPKYWLFGNKIEFRGTSEVKRITRDKDERYAILDYKEATEIRETVKTFYVFNVYSILVYYPKYGRKLVDSNMLDDNYNGAAKSLKKGPYLFKVSLPGPFLNDRGMKFALYQFKEYIERAKTEGFSKKIFRPLFKLADPNPSDALTLKEKTLLIPEELLTIDKSQIKGEYKFPFKVLPLAQIDSL